MKTFKNTNWTKRNYNCTNVVCCQGETAPAKGNWVEVDDDAIKGMTQLWIENNVRFWGYM